MKPHFCCRVRAASYLLSDSDVIFLFLSTAAALRHARSEDDMSFVTDFAKRFEDAFAYCSKARVGMRLLKVLKLCYNSARPMRQLCAFAANNGDHRYIYERFTAARGPVSIHTYSHLCRYHSG